MIVNTFFVVINNVSCGFLPPLFWIYPLENLASTKQDIRTKVMIPTVIYLSHFKAATFLKLIKSVN